MSTLTDLIERPCEDFSAIHGTSLSFLKKIESNGAINNGGNFDNYFYILVEKNKPGINIIESATYYAETNAIKDLLFELHPELLQTITQKHIDPYLFSVGLSQLGLPGRKFFPSGFDDFSPMEVEWMKSAIAHARKDDRRGVIIYFSQKLLDDYVVEDITDTSQGRIMLTKPIALDDICSIRLLGQFEKSQFSFRFGGKENL